MYEEKKEKTDELKALRLIAIVVAVWVILTFATGFGQHGNETNRLQILEKKIHLYLEARKK